MVNKSKLKPRQWTTIRRSKREGGTRACCQIAYVKSGKHKSYIEFTVPEHFRQFSALLAEAGYSYVSFETLGVDNIFQL